MNRTVLWVSIAVVIIIAGAFAAQRIGGAGEQAKVAKSPPAIITEKIRTEVGRQLRDIGASFEDLQVKVDVNRDSATPFRVTYKGLKNFKAAAGQAPAVDGSFVMEYTGGGKWQGKLGGMQFVTTVGTTDNIDLPFENDPSVIGQWKSVDFVATPDDFNPEKKHFRGQLYLVELAFLADGKTTKPWWTWTKGFLLHQGDKTASKYEIKEIKGETYLFLEWKSGDVMISGLKPQHYVLQKKAR